MKMYKAEYLNTLDRLLGKMSIEEKKDILYDYEEHINMAIESGKPEEEAIKSLGAPVLIAKQYKVDQLIKKAEETYSIKNIFRAVFAALGLVFFNLVFVLGPFLGVFGIFIGLFVTAVSHAISGIVVTLSITISYLKMNLKIITR